MPIRNSTLVGKKKCSKCGNEKTITEFPVERLRNGVPGLGAQCKICVRKRNRVADRRFKDKLLAERRSKGIRARKPNGRVENGKKTCARCGVTKPLSQFVKKTYPRKNGTPSFGNCLVCVRGDMTHYSRKFRYGITKEQYEQRVVDQKGACAICRKVPKSDARGHSVLCVDHNHETGKIRGLLCQTCNRLLGQAKDNPAALQVALDYLQRAATL